jgi:hypothetical protein
VSPFLSLQSNASFLSFRNSCFCGGGHKKEGASFSLFISLSSFLYITFFSSFSFFFLFLIFINTKNVIKKDKRGGRTDVETKQQKEVRLMILKPNFCPITQSPTL